MLKRYLSVLATVALLIAAFTACGASSDMNMKAETAEPAMRSEVKASYDEGGFAENEESMKYAKKALDTAATPEEKKQDIRKIIKDGDIAVEVENVEKAYIGIIEIVNEIGGEEFNKNYYDSGEYKRMELVLKIPPENLDEFQDRLSEYVGSGKIKRTNIRSQDISSEYYDVQARLESYTASRDQLRDLIKKAENVEDTLKIHNELTRLQGEIDVLQGRIKMWDKLVSMSTVNLFIDQEIDPLKHTKTVGWKFNSVQDILNTMKNGFISVVNVFYSILIWIVIIFVSLLPVLIPAAIIVFIIIRWQRKKKKNNKDGHPLA